MSSPCCNFESVKKYYLEPQEEEELVLFGLVSNEKPHRMAFLINDTLHYDLHRNKDIPYMISEQEDANFPRFDYSDELNRLQFHLLGNRDDGHCLLPELKQIDYLLMVKGAIDYLNEDELTLALKKVEGVQLVTRLKKEQLKSYQNLIIPD